MILWLFFLFVAFAALLLTWAIRRYALAREMIDIPNERSSHTTPTPRGGGVAIVLSFLGGLIVLESAGFIPAYLFWALLGAGAWTAMLGWIDDRTDISAFFRLPAHFIGAAWALAWLGGLAPLSVFGYVLDLGWTGHVLAAFYLVWLLNLYNFMDGINGIAGIEAITVCAGAAVLWVLSPAGSALWILPVLAAAATAGFLYWNFPGARIFMGDAGSGFLGLVLGILSIQAALAAPGLFWAWVILLGAFIVDATVTLLRRAWNGEKLYQAHRSHAYQHAARRFGSHWPVALAFGAINLFWLLPVAALVVLGRIDGITGVVVAYAPLIWAAFRFKAGRQSEAVEKSPGM